MSDSASVSTRQVWERRLQEAGFTDARFFAFGAEGDVFQLSDNRLAKVWREGAPVDRVQRVATAVGGLHLPFRTPPVSRCESDRRSPSHS